MIWALFWTNIVQGLERNRYKISHFHQNIMKYHQKIQLEHYFSQRVFRVRTKQNILGLSTLRAFFKSEEIEARGSVPTALTC